MSFAKILASKEINIKPLIEFANYLIANAFEKTFFGAFGKRALEEKQFYLDYFNSRNMIMLPWKAPEKFFDKMHLEDPANIVKYSEFTSFIDFIEVNPANYVTLDSTLAPLFRASKKPDNQLIILITDPDLEYFKDVIDGIPYGITYKFKPTTQDIVLTIKSILLKCVEKNKAYSDIAFHFAVGTTAIDKVKTVPARK